MVTTNHLWASIDCQWLSQFLSSQITTARILSQQSNDYRGYYRSDQRWVKAGRVIISAGPQLPWVGDQPSGRVVCPRARFSALGRWSGGGGCNVVIYHFWWLPLWLSGEQWPGGYIKGAKGLCCPCSLLCQDCWGFPLWQMYLQTVFVHFNPFPSTGWM